MICNSTGVMGLDRWCLAVVSFFTKTTGNKKPAQKRGFFVGFDVLDVLQRTKPDLLVMEVAPVEVGLLQLEVVEIPMGQYERLHTSSKILAFSYLVDLI